MSEVSSHHSISAACEYSGKAQILIFDDQPLSNMTSLPLPRQGPRVHVEPAEPAEERRPEFSHATGAGVRPHPAGPG